MYLTYRDFKKCKEDYPMIKTFILFFGSLSIAFTECMNPNQNKLLFQAAATGDIAVVREALDNGVDVNRRSNPGDLDTIRKPICATYGTSDTLNRSGLHNVLGGWDIGLRGSTPLMIAVSKRNEEVVKLLIACGADVNVRDDDHYVTALERLAWLPGTEADAKIAKILIKAGAKVYRAIVAFYLHKPSKEKIALAKEFLRACDIVAITKRFFSAQLSPELGELLLRFINNPKKCNEDDVERFIINYRSLASIPDNVICAAFLEEMVSYCPSLSEKIIIQIFEFAVQRGYSSTVEFLLPMLISRNLLSSLNLENLTAYVDKRIKEELEKSKDNDKAEQFFGNSWHVLYLKVAHILNKINFYLHIKTQIKQNGDITSNYLQYLPLDLFLELVNFIPMPPITLSIKKDKDKCLIS